MSRAVAALRRSGAARRTRKEREDAWPTGPTGTRRSGPASTRSSTRAGGEGNLAALLRLVPAEPWDPPWRAGVIRGHAPVGSGQSVLYQSDIEGVFLEMLRFEPGLAAVSGRPIEADATTGGRWPRRHRPAFLVVHGGPRPMGHLVEVHWTQALKADWRGLRPLLRASRSRAAELGLGFLLVTERQMERLPWASMRFLGHYLGVEGDEGIEAHLLHRLAGIGPATPAKLLAACFETRDNQAMAVSHLWKLLAQGRIRADLRDDNLTMSTPVWIDTKGDRRRVDPYARRQARAGETGDDGAGGAAEAPATVADLSALVRQLARFLRAREPDSKLASAAVDYLRRKGLTGNILRQRPEAGRP